jgi:cytochrome oxidase Cu insertion factor (SCO1/SenC/PrrC family)
MVSLSNAGASASGWFARAGLMTAVVLFLACAGVVIRGSGRAAVAVASVAGGIAEPFRLPDLDSRLISLNDLRGRVIVLCITQPDTCAGEVFPRLLDVMRPLADEPRVQTITILRTDSAPGSPEVNRLRVDLAAAGMRWPALLDVASDVSRDYRAVHGTSLFVIDATGVIRHRADDVQHRPEAFAQTCAAVDRLLERDRSAPLASVRR